MFRSWYATCPRGAEDALEKELQGIGAKGIRPGIGGVRFTGPRETALRACLELRTALRVLEPLAEFAATTSNELYEGVKTIAWADHVTERQTIAVSASGKAEGLTHTHFVEMRTKDGIVDTLREKKGFRPNVDTRNPDVLVVVHLGKGRCDVSIDLAGDLLSNRGYRMGTVEAPLRESLAAAMVLYSAWDGETPLHDPVCGSGTLAIEAALFAARRAPNLDRKLACEKRIEDARVLARLREELRGRIRKTPRILASDRDPDAVAATRTNAQAAGVDIEVYEADARQVKPLDPPGQLLLNVPYGERLEAGGNKPLKSFYHQLGEAMRRLHGHKAAILSGSENFESAFGVRPRGKRTIWNGPLKCGLYFYEF